MGLEPTTLSLGNHPGGSRLSHFRTAEPNASRWNPPDTARPRRSLARNWRAPLSDHASVQLALYIFGAVFEFVGIVIIAAPDFFPFARRAARGLQAVTSRIRRLIGRPRTRIIDVGTIGATSTMGALGLVKASGAETLEGKVEFLLRRDEEAQNAINAVHARLDAIESASPKRLAELREELVAHVTAEREVAEATYRTERIVGTIALAIGLALSTLGNVV
jgi:hypothetical protein